MDALRGKVRTLPRSAGVYLWKDGDGRVLYVGKASDLRSRVGSYFSRSIEPRKLEMMQRVADVDFVGTKDGADALLLEQTLIKEHRPQYNVILRDDKSYPFISVTHEAFPRIVYTRRPGRGDTVFGPFADAGSAKRVARMLNRTFLLRQCRVLPKRECIYYHMGQCSAPCIDVVDEATYGQQVEQAVAFLRGGGTGMAKDLRRRMAVAAEAQRFEEAAALRDAAASVETVVKRQFVDRPTGEDLDAVGVVAKAATACAVVVRVRDGRVVGKDHFFLSLPPATTPPETLAAFLGQYYAQAPRPATRILLPFQVDEARTLERAIGGRVGRRCQVLVPHRGARRRHVELAEDNAALHLEQELLRRERHGAGALESLAEALGLPEPPSRIEGFDVSHHKGEHTVASLVVLRDGRPHKAGYRRFKIETASGGDDPGAMQEAVGRRYRRVLSEDGADALPDLIVVDGGRAQLGAALSSLAELGLESLPVIGLAKRLEEIHRPKRLHPLELPSSSPALHVLQRVRDEAHRFAITYSDRLKRNQLLRSELDDVPGVGPERKRRLLSAFGSLDAVRRASVDELMKVPGIPRRVAEAVRRGLNPPSASGQG